MYIAQESLTGKGPKNKKQIGRVSKKDKIYIEDYAVTYLRQIARSQEHKSGFAGLFGTCREVEGNKEYYIYAAVYQEGENIPKGGLPRETVQKIMRQRTENFPEYFFLGWAFVFNEAMGTMWENCYRSRLETLMGKPELLLTIKKNTCEEHFYLYPTEMPASTDGYFIFYEQNDAMQNFLIDWHDEIHKTRCDEEGDHVAESCRNYYKEKKAAKMRTRLAGAFVSAAVLLLIFCAGVGIQNLNQYDKMKEVGNTLETVSGLDAGDIQPETGTSETVVTYVDTSETELPVADEEVFLETEAETQVSEGGSYGSEYANLEYEKMQATDDSEGEEKPDVQDMTVAETDVTEEQVAEQKMEETMEPGNNYVTYEVSKGDTLYGICVRFYGDLSRAKEICELNGIENKDNILYGQKILLPE